MESSVQNHPSNPRSNIAKLGIYDPNKYTLHHVSQTIQVDEGLLPGRAPSLTQKTVGKYLQPLTRELAEVPPRATVDQLPNAVIEHMVKKDKGFWVDKPGANAYALHDAFYQYGMTSEIVKPTHQEVFPRSYKYDLDCVKYRQRHACDNLKQGRSQKSLSAHCRDCGKMGISGLTPFQLAWAHDPGQRRWRYYPDLTTNLTPEEIRGLMAEVGRPYQNEACIWYNKHYPSAKFNCISRKFSK